MNRSGDAFWRHSRAVILALTLAAPAWGDVDRVTVTSPQKQAWLGERTPFFIAIRGPGPFVGATSFSLPQIPRAVIVSVGNPVVSSEEIDGDAWFVRTQEFAIFSQAAGDVVVPAFEVRYSTRDGFTGPTVDHVEQVPAQSFKIKRPPGSDAGQFLVTTPKLEIDESWDPQSGRGKVGDVFRRTITQTADQMTGMALAPPPTDAPEGVRVYLAQPEVTDKTERGEFTGLRRDVLTYSIQRPGTFTLPAIEYRWWNPKTEQFGSKALPAVTFDVAAATPKPTGERTPRWISRWLVALSVGIVTCGIIAWQRRNIVTWSRRLWRKLNPPRRVAARNLLAASRRDDAHAAEAAWFAWQNLQSPRFQPSPALAAATTDLHRHLYGRQQASDWRGVQLAGAFRNQLAADSQDSAPAASALPPLNP